MPYLFQVKISFYVQLDFLEQGIFLRSNVRRATLYCSSDPILQMMNSNSALGHEVGFHMTTKQLRNCLKQLFRRLFHVRCSYLCFFFPLYLLTFNLCLLFRALLRGSTFYSSNNGFVMCYTCRQNKNVKLAAKRLFLLEICGHLFIGL